MAILSHGIEDGFVYASDGLMKIDEFVNAFKPSNCPSLFQKPKLFFIQACRGYEMDNGVMFGGPNKEVGNSVQNWKARSGYKTWPLDADILIEFWSNFLYRIAPGASMFFI